VNRRCPSPVKHHFGGLSNSTGLHAVADTRATNHRPNKPICNPIPFDGKQLEIKDWICNFENCKSVNQWTDQECIQILPALQLYNDMTDVEKGDYTTLVKTLVKKFDPI